MHRLCLVSLGKAGYGLSWLSVSSFIAIDQLSQGIAVFALKSADTFLTFRLALGMAAFQAANRPTLVEKPTTIDSSSLGA